MAAGHAIPLIMFEGIQRISDKVGDKTPFKRDGVEMGHCIARPDGREEDIADK